MGVVLLWDDIELQRAKLWRVGAMSALLIFAESLHFYATLILVCVAMMELLWSALNHRIRIPIWLGLFLAGAASFAWFPFMQADSRFNASDTASIDYYAVPTSGKLLHAYTDLMIQDKKQILFLAATICVIGAISARGGSRVASSITPEAWAERSRSNLYVIAFSTITYPLLVFIFSEAVTHTFNLRYSLIGTFGFACLLACTIDSIPVFKSAASAILLASCPLALLSAKPLSVSIPDQVLVVQHASKPYPIVIGEGRLYFELEEAVPAEMKSRLVFLETPPGAVNPDPTNEHLLERWRQIRPDLRIMSAKDFFARNPRFYLFQTGATTDAITNWLIDGGWINRPIARYEYAWLFEAEALNR